MLLTITLIIILVATLCVLWALKRQDELSELKEELDKYSLHLDERANQLAADEAVVRGLNLQLRRELIRLGIVEDSPSGDGDANPQ